MEASAPSVRVRVPKFARVRARSTRSEEKWEVSPCEVLKLLHGGVEDGDFCGAAQDSSDSGSGATDPGQSPLTAGRHRMFWVWRAEVDVVLSILRKMRRGDLRRHKSRRYDGQISLNARFPGEHAETWPAPQFGPTRLPLKWGNPVLLDCFFISPFHCADPRVLAAVGYCCSFVSVFGIILLVSKQPPCDLARVDCTTN